MVPPLTYGRQREDGASKCFLSEAELLFKRLSQQGFKQTENREALSDDSKIQKDELVVESSSYILCVFSPMGEEEDEVMTTLW